MLHSLHQTCEKENEIKFKHAKLQVLTYDCLWQWADCYFTVCYSVNIYGYNTSDKVNTIDCAWIYWSLCCGSYIESHASCISCYNSASRMSLKFEKANYITSFNLLSWSLGQRVTLLRSYGTFKAIPAVLIATALHQECLWRLKGKLPLICCHVHLNYKGVSHVHRM